MKTNVKTFWNKKVDFLRWKSINLKEGTKHFVRTEKAINLIENFVPKGGKVLEIGFAHGVLAKRIIDLGYDYTGVDISEKFKQLATYYCEGKGNFFVRDFEEIGFDNDFKNETFDCVVELGVLHYAKNPKNFLEKCKRLLKKDGLLIIVQRNSLRTSNKYGFLPRFFYKIGFPYEINNLLKVRKLAFTPKKLKELIEKSSFKIISMELLGKYEDTMVIVAKK